MYDRQINLRYMKRVLVCVEKIPSKNLVVAMQRDTNMFEALQLAQTTAANIQYNIKTDLQGRADLVGELLESYQLVEGYTLHRKQIIPCIT